MHYVMKVTVKSRDVKVHVIDRKHDGNGRLSERLPVLMAPPAWLRLG
jgi:hypothetical protein